VPDLLIFGLGYSGSAIAHAARKVGFRVRWTVRATATQEGEVPFAAAAPAIAAATHILSTIPPDASGDPVMALYARDIAAAPSLRWAGYLSSTVVYGDRGGGWVNEDTPPAPSQQRGHYRLAAEQAWARLTPRITADLFRLAGIYGPGRSAFDALRQGRARIIAKPGHAFGRIHRDDITQAVLAAVQRHPPAGVRVFNLTDDQPAENGAVIREAARLLGVIPPPAIPFETALHTMPPMARSFWMENRKVSSAKTKAALGISWRYPTFRDGLAAILAEERRHRPA
jgi:nucleoside-diphosphate-sugar epimerase